MTTSLHGGTAPLAALTTVFSPPCPTSWLVTTTKLPSQFPWFPAADAAETTCDPPAWASNLAGEGFQYYSPAICPDGFEVGFGCILTGTPRTTEGFPAVAAGETVAWCVPSGQSCTSDTTDFRGGIWGVMRTATGASAAVTVGPAIQIRFRDVDLSILATHPLTPGLTLAKATSATSSTPAPTPTPPPAKLTPAVAATSSQTTQNTQSTQDSSSSASPTTSDDSTAAGFVTVKGKSTTISPTTSSEPITSTVQVVSRGSTFMSTVVMSPTAVSTNGGSSTSDAAAGFTASNSTSNATTSSSPTRAFTATIVMAVILSVVAATIVAFFLLTRRRYRWKQQQKKQGGVLPKTEPSVHEGSSSLGLSSVGVGAWVHRKRPRWRIVWHRTRAWWSNLRLLPWQRHSPLTGDNRRWGRRRPSLRDGQELNVADVEASRARTPLAELPTSERVLADYVELEGSPVPERPAENNQGVYDDDDDDADSYMSLQKFKGIPARRLSANSTSRANRLSWISRLSRYMRGRPSTAGGDGRDTPMSIDDAATGADRSVLSRTSTRSSRWTRAGDVDDCPFGTMESGDVHERSWEAFSRSREGLGRLLLVKKGSAGSPMPSYGARRGHQRGLSVPTNGTAKGLPRLPSPAITVDSDRIGTPGPGWLSANGGNANHFSRLSNGTFGRMDSFISRDGSRIGDMPGGTQNTEANS